MSTELQHTDTDIDWVELSELYRLAPLGEKPAEWLRVAFSNSMFKCFVFDEGVLVGAGRAVADGVDVSCICDIAVHPSHQGKGFGVQIVSSLLERSRGHRKIILYSVPGRENLYRRLGFRRMRTAMAVFSDAQKAVRDGYVDES